LSKAPTEIRAGKLLGRDAEAAAMQQAQAMQAATHLSRIIAPLLFRITTVLLFPVTAPFRQYLAGAFGINTKPRNFIIGRDEDLALTSLKHGSGGR
jgi:hypothetical protein